MEVESVIELFNYCWFEENILKKETNPTANLDGDLEIEIQNNNNPEEFNLFCRSRSILARSVSDDLTSQVSCMSGSASPHSVLPHLQTVPSKKEINEMEDDRGGRAVIKFGKKKKKKGSSMSKSLSELEFEEVKGFMDLGFVFSEEDEESDLASIIPGLGKKNKKKTKAIRPYLSETWEWLNLDKRNKEKPLLMMMNWNETDMKHNLKSWAHTVVLASAVC